MCFPSRWWRVALSIGVKVGSRIAVGNHIVRVTDVLRADEMKLTVDDGPDILISDKQTVMILPEVHVFAGIGVNGVGRRLAFEAPREIPIHRLG